MKTLWDLIEWRPVVGFEDTHLVSSDGRVKRVRDRFGTHRETFLQGWISDRGYRYVHLSDNGRKVKVGVHRIVLIAFTDRECPADKPEVNHIDGDKTNNRLSNLEWVSASENSWHRSNVVHKAEQAVPF